MPIKLTKNGVDSSFSGSEKIFKKGREKNQTCYKREFFLIFFLQNTTIKFKTKISKKKLKNHKDKITYDIYLLLVDIFFWTLPIYQIFTNKFYTVKVYLKQNLQIIVFFF